MQDSYKVHYNKEYLKIPDPNAKPSGFMAKFKKKDDNNNVDEEKDKSGFSDKSGKKKKD